MERIQKATQAYSQAPWRKQMQLLGLFLVVLVFSALVAGVYLSITARAAQVGRDIQEMERTLVAIEHENADLRSKLATLTSATEMEKRARGMGFQRIALDQALYILVPEYTGRQPVILAPIANPTLVSAPVFPAEYTESLLDWLQRELKQSSVRILIGLQP